MSITGDGLPRTVSRTRFTVPRDVIVGALLFAVAAIGGAALYKSEIRSGRHPFFYQSYFEPAVMTACGRGFLVAPPGQQPAALRAFLAEQVDRFSCDQLPRDLRVGTEGLYQRPWRYLMLSVAFAWMVLGISWSGLGPLFGVLFGSTIVLVYAACRQIVGAAAAVACAGAVALSPLQLSNLPNLRDYAKAPFTIALLLLLVALVVRPWRPRGILALSLAYGVVLGIGYGFRTDLLVDIPPFIVAIALFLPYGLAERIPLKLAALALCAGGFVASGWPIISTVVERGGCQWHVFLLGLTSPFDEALRVHGGSYAWGHLYKDEYVWANVSSFAHRVRPDVGYIEYCTHEYDVASWAYLREILARFPADMLTRGYAAALHVVDIAFARLRMPLGVGVAAAAAFVAIVSASSVRLALFAVFAIVYFGGYPAIQFLPRHYFLFEFIGWLVIAFLVERGAGVAIRSSRAEQPSRELRAWQRPALVSVGVVAALAAPLIALRSYQTARVRTLLGSYIAAPSSPLPLTVAAPGQYRLADRPQPPHTTADALATIGRADARFIEVRLDSRACRPGTTVTFVYDASHPEIDFTRQVVVQPAPGPTRLFEPIYSAFLGLDVSDPAPSCAPQVSVVGDRGVVPLLLEAQLQAGWESQAQYQRIEWRR